MRNLSKWTSRGGSGHGVTISIQRYLLPMDDLVRFDATKPYHVVYTWPDSVAGWKVTNEFRNPGRVAETSLGNYAVVRFVDLELRIGMLVQ